MIMYSWGSAGKQGAQLHFHVHDGLCLKYFQLKHRLDGIPGAQLQPTLLFYHCLKIRVLAWHHESNSLQQWYPEISCKHVKLL